MFLFFIHSSVDGHLGCFLILVIVSTLHWFFPTTSVCANHLGKFAKVWVLAHKTGVGPRTLHL